MMRAKDGEVAHAFQPLLQVSRVGDQLVRPHDIAVSGSPSEGALEAMVRRVVHLGFEVRLELVLEGDAPLSVQITRGEAAELELAPGDIVYVRSATGHAVHV